VGDASKVGCSGADVVEWDHAVSKVTCFLHDRGGLG
jgi:hypothetical protein